MENSVAFGGMVMVILVQAGSMIVNKAAMSKGSNKYVMVVYGNALSSLLLLPSFFIFIFNRSSHRPPLTFSILCRFFLLAVFGCSGQIFSYVGIDYSSPTLGTAMLNLIPAFTFILAVIFRMETVCWRSSSSQAKVIGSIVSITGAFVVTFYKGPPLINIIPTPNISLHNQLLSPSQISNWILGAFFLAADSFSTSLWYIVQASPHHNKYPVLFTVFFQSLFSTIQSAIFTLIAIKDATAWELRLDAGLIAILYTGIVATVVRYSLLTWCVWKAGALYCSMFKPLAIIFGVIMGVIFLGDSIHLGSLVGAAVIVSGFYGVMWGKAKEDHEKLVEDGEAETGHLESLDQNKEPLLPQNKRQEKHNCSSILCR